MKCSYTYIKLERSENVEDHAQELLMRLSKFFDRPLKAHFTFAHEKYNHRVSLMITGKDMYFKAEALSENFYASMEGAVDKVHRQLEKKKNKQRNHKLKNPAKELNSNVVYMDDYRREMETRGRKSS